MPLPDDSESGMHGAVRARARAGLPLCFNRNGIAI
jgi:hypothetical protein